MTKSCSLCQDERRIEIDKRLLGMEFSKETYRRLSSEFHVHEATLRRHKKKCLSIDLGDVHRSMELAREQALAEVRETELEQIKTACKEGTIARLENANNLLDQLKEIRERAVSLLDRAEEAEDLRAAGTFLRELREQIRLWAELEGRISNQPQVTIVNNPEWIELRCKITEALDSFPEAKEAVVLAIRGCGRGHDE